MDARCLNDLKKIKTLRLIRDLKLSHHSEHLDEQLHIYNIEWLIENNFLSPLQILTYDYTS